jgi:hypothetical protein
VKKKTESSREEEGKRTGGRTTEGKKRIKGERREER